MHNKIFLIIIVLFVFSPKARTAASIILRGANDFMCDEMERSVHDALCVVKRVLESKTVVPGGGAVEAALSIYLENFASSLVGTNIKALVLYIVTRYAKYLQLSYCQFFVISCYLLFSLVY